MEKSDPQRSVLTDYSMLLYGREKIGKTTLLAHFPDVLFMFTEPGNKDLRIFEMYVHSWQDFRDAVTLLQEEHAAGKSRFRTVAIDTVDILWDYCEDFTCMKLAIDHLSDEDWGKGYRAAKREFVKWVSALMKMDMGVVFVSHDQFREIKTRDGGKTDRILPTLAGSARGVLEPMVDVWAYYQYDENNKRVLQIRGDDLVSAGHRSETHFIGLTHIPMGNSSEEAFANFMAAFENKPASKGGSKPARASKKIVRKKGVRRVSK